MSTRKDRLAAVLEAILDRCDSIDRKLQQVVEVTVQLTRDVATHETELAELRRSQAALERRTAAYDAE